MHPAIDDERPIGGGISDMPIEGRSTERALACPTALFFIRGDATSVMDVLVPAATSIFALSDMQTVLTRRVLTVVAGLAALAWRAARRGGAARAHAAPVAGH